MKLIFDGVAFSILILIAMLIICHTANLLMDTKSKTFSRNKFINLPKDLPVKYNQIYFDKQEGESCKIKKEAEVPCKIVPECTTKTGMELLSDSEIAMLYKYIMERAGFEVAHRTLTCKN
jgi:hypothetical protein